MIGTFASTRSVVLISTTRFRMAAQQQKRFNDMQLDPAKLSRKKAIKAKKIRKTMSYTFVDRARIMATGGSGGKGCLSAEQQQQRYKLRPDGGHGGNGGCVIIVADPTEQTLRRSGHAKASDASNGGPAKRLGRNGANFILRVPCGVIVRRVLDHGDVWNPIKKEVVRPERNIAEYVYDSEEEDDALYQYQMMDQEEWLDDEEDEDDDTPEDERETVVVADLDAPGSYCVVAKGGQGGYGTMLYASEHGSSPSVLLLKRNATPQKGESVSLELELKMIADLGLVGFPNAGKSSLLRAMSMATPEVAPYPFTTLHPLMGMIDYRDGYRIRAADIPGLVRGAAEGRGKGHDFLRHVERTKALMYIVDVAGTDFRDPIEDLLVLADELSAYGDGSLLERRAIVVANKVDLLARERIPEILFELGEAAKGAGIQFEHDVMGISAGVTGEGLGELSKAIRYIVSKTEEERLLAFEHAT
jgi:GTP-binding protein